MSSSATKESVYQERTYRDKTVGHDLIEQTIIQNESDLQIYSNIKVVDVAESHLEDIRKILSRYIEKQPEFQTSLKPIEAIEDQGKVHYQIQKMIEASKKAAVGPMAAVAGAVSQYVAECLLEEEEGLTDIFIENGGDIYLKSTAERRILVHAGESVLSEKIALKIKPEMTPCGICTSSGTVGHSLSFGKADAVVVISRDTCLADATATSVGNMVKSHSDIEKGIDFAKSIDGIDGILIIVKDKIGAWGQIELC